MKKTEIITIMGLALLVASCDGVKQVKSVNIDERITVSEELEKDTVILEMEYFGWTCPCAQWITPENKRIYDVRKNRYVSYNDSLFYHAMPSSDTIPGPFDLTENMNHLKFHFTGRFFKEMQYMGEEGEMEPAITLMYDRVELIEE